MAEKQNTGEVVSMEEGEKIATVRPSRQPFFGTLLFSVLVLIILVAVGLLSWWGYRGWRFTEERSTLPSIASLEVVPETQENTAPEEVAKPVEQAPTASKEEALKKVQAIDIKVMNGGAAKGSAGILGESLKKGGYTKVSVGNTTGNYTGTVIYFASGLDQEAATLKETLVKTYPKVETKAALAENKETSLSPLTVILGKE